MFDENGVNLTLIDYMLSLTPTQRLETLEEALRFERAVADARIELVGWDPRAALEARFGLNYMPFVIRPPRT